MEASKWLQIQALLAEEEMASLLDFLGEMRIFLIGQVVEQAEISKQQFFEHYCRYVLQLKKGEIPEAPIYRQMFSCVFTTDKEHLMIVSIRENKKIARVVKPVIQLQLHTMGYSTLENKFRPMVFGNDSIHWGLAFSYPQLFLDPATRKVEKVLEENHFPNTSLFRTLQKWIRGNTLPTPFIVGEERINVPMRLGKECLPWINTHPQLAEKGIRVELLGVS